MNPEMGLSLLQQVEFVKDPVHGGFARFILVSEKGVQEFTHFGGVGIVCAVGGAGVPKGDIHEDILDHLVYIITF